MATFIVSESQPAVVNAGMHQKYMLLKELGKASACRGWLPVIVLVASDFVMLSAAALSSLYLMRISDSTLSEQHYAQLWPALLTFHIAFFAVNLYSVVAVNAVDEFRRLTLCTTLIFMSFGATSFLFQNGLIYSRQIVVMAWLVSIGLLPLGRACIRSVVTRCKWWGKSAIVVCAGEAGERVVTELTRRPELGLRPVAVFDVVPGERADIKGIPRINDVALVPQLAADLGVSHCILALAGIPVSRQLELLERYHGHFKHCIVVPNVFEFATLRVPTIDLGNILGLDVQQPLLMTVPRFIKRFADIVLTVVGGILILPLMALLYVLVKLDSPGPAIFGHKRIGRNGCHFKAWKFRSMYQDSKERFINYVEYGNNTMGDHWNDLTFWNQCLKNAENAREEWENSQKLRGDPRVTRIGKFLRKTSLDELPQIWNVLMGEMSLVGPRPIVDEEVAKYEQYFDLYLKVTPGISGLWQVSGRTDTTYKERVQLDTYYVRNWSLWLDVYILARTVLVVLFGRGAY